MWREMFGRTIAKLDFEPVLAGAFAAQATLPALPGMGLVSMTSRDLHFHKLPHLIDNDDLILAIVVAHHSGRGRKSGVEVDTRFYEVYTLREGKVSRVDEYTERAEALQAAGLSE